MSWSPGGEPYTFRLDVVQDGRPVTQPDLQDLKNAVLRAKNLRSRFGITIRGELEGKVILAGYMVARETVTYLPANEGLLSESGDTFITEDGERLTTELRFAL